MKKRLLALSLTLCMLLSLLPAVSLQARAELSVSTENFMRLGETAPEGFDKNSTLNPYGSNNAAFMLYTAEELLLYTNRGSGGSVSVLDTYKTNAGTNVPAGKAGSYETSTPLGNTQACDYVRAVSGDFVGGTEGGKKQYVAYAGYSGSGTVKLWVQNAASGAIVASTELSCKDAIFQDAEYFQHNTIIGVTAGDFDGDGKDSIVVYCATDGAGALREYVLEGASLNLRCSTELSSLHPYGSAAANATEIRNYLSVSITAGDLDGDGRDELGVAAGVNGAHGGGSSSITDHGTYVSVFQLDTARFQRSSQICMMTKQLITPDEDDKHWGYYTIYAPGISAGDLDNDSVEELVVAGYLSTPETSDTSTEDTMSGDASKYDNLDKLCGDKIGVATVVYAGNGTYAGSDVLMQAANAATDAGLYRSGINQDYCWPQTAVQCYAINGIKGDEYVFVCGTVYKVTGGSAWESVYTPKYFNNSDSGSFGVSVSNAYVETVTAGNFDGNQVGREQVVYTVALKSSGASSYHHILGMTGGTYSDTNGNYGLVKDYFCSHTGDDPISDDYIYTDNSGVDGDLGEHLSVVPVAVDTDDDGVRARLSQTGYVYSDPEVKAVLQAAPFFGELGEYGDFDSGATSYTISTGYEFTHSTSDSVSFGTGISSDMEAGPVSWSLNAGYSMEWSKTYEDSVSTSYAKTFEAHAEDTVALMRTLLYIYLYDIYDKDTGTWKTDSYCLSVPQEPSYLQLSVEDYNAFVDYYNGMLTTSGTRGDSDPDDVKLVKITGSDLPESNEGNPFAYFSSGAQAGAGYTSLSQSPNTLGTTTGSITDEWSTEDSHSVGTETSNGFHFDTTLMFGGNGGFGPVQVAEGWLGFHLSLEYLHGKGTTETTVSGEGASGTVSDLCADNLVAQGIPLSVIQSYTYSWTFGMWTRNLGCGNVRFFGYILSGLDAPPPAPQNLRLEAMSTTSFMLVWDAPDVEQRSYDAFNVWRLEGGDYTLLNDEPIPAGTTQFLLEDLDSNTEYSYVVTTMRYISATNVLHSIWSEPVSASTPKADYRFTLSVSPTGTAAASATFDGDEPAISGKKFIEGTMFNISATANPGYVITGYQVLRGESAPYDVPIAPSTELFVRVQLLSGDSEYRIMAKRAGGVVTYNVNDTSRGSLTATVGTTPFASGETANGVVHLTAAPAEGSVLTGWRITLGAETPYFIPADGLSLDFTPLRGENHVEAMFADPTPANTHTVTVDTSVRRGVITVTDEAGDTLTPLNGQLVVTDGAKLTFTSVPADGYFFDYWTGDLLNTAGSVNPYTVTVTGDLSVSATYYAPILRTVSYSAYNAVTGSPSTLVGSVSAVQNGETFASGDGLLPGATGCIFTATAAEGYAFRKWVVNGRDSDEVGTVLTVPVVNSNYTIRAEFALLPTIITASLPGCTLGDDYDQTVSGTVPDDSYAWSVVSGSLPSGLSLNALTGVITGKAAAEGRSNFTLELKSAKWGYSVQKEYAITVSKAFVPVTGIAYTGKTQVEKGGSIVLSAAVTPVNASCQDIVWTAAAGKGTITGDSLTADAAGTITVTATIAGGGVNGGDFTKDFTIFSFVPVTNITGIPGETGIERFSSIVYLDKIDLFDARVEPADATNKTIRWTVVRDYSSFGSVGDPSVYRLTDEGSSQISMLASNHYLSDYYCIKAVIENGLGEGKDYEQLFITRANWRDPNYNGQNFTIDDMADTMAAGGVLPLQASSRQTTDLPVTWTITEDGGTGAAISIVSAGDDANDVSISLSAQYPGTLKIRGTIYGGSWDDTKGTGDVTRDFTITVTENVTPGKITGIFVDGETLAPAFSSTTYGYTVEVPATKQTADLSVTADENVRIGIEGKLRSNLDDLHLEDGITSVKVSGFFDPDNNGILVTTEYMVDIIRPVVRTDRITGVPEAMLVGESLELGDLTTLYPDAATYKDYTWSLAETDCAELSGDTLTAKAAGFITLTATNANGLADGTPYVREFTVRIDSPDVTGVEPPVASTPGGIYGESKSVGLSTDTSGASIYYTLDGSTPTTDSALYSSTLPIDSSTLLRAVAVKEDVTSGITEERYTITNSQLVTITATAGPNGAVSPSCEVSVVIGARQTFYFTPDTDYQVSDVKVDGVSVGARSMYTFENVTENHTIEASFTILTPPPGRCIVIVDDVGHLIGYETAEGNGIVATAEQDKLAEYINTAGTGSSVIFCISDAEAVRAVLPLNNIVDMAAKGMTLIVRSGGVSYEIPATAIDTEALMVRLGSTDASEVLLSAAFSRLSGDGVTLTSGTLLLPPVSFTVTGTLGTNSIEVRVFDRYVRRVIEIPDTVDHAQVTTAVVLKNGTQRHVPTEVFEEDGKWYARISSLTDSDYALINYYKSFADSRGAWFESVVTEMSGRGIISGRSAGVYDGEADITRAEFSAILVRALGLPQDGDASMFLDVSSDAWYYGAVGKAFEYGLIFGRAPTAFDPTASITREEAMAMVHRAAAITELEGATDNLSAFTDADSISDWALGDVRWNVGSGLVFGSDGKICPLDNITRAETAALILRLLQKSALVDVRPVELSPYPKGGLRDDGSFDEGTLFLGDSITFGFIDKYLTPNGHIGDASYMAIGGMPLKQFFSTDMLLGSDLANRKGCLYSEGFYGLSYAQAIASAAGRFHSVYFLLGSNLSGESPAEMYVDALDYILEHNPNAVIYLQTIPNCTTGNTNSNQVNTNVRAAVKTYADANDSRVQLLDTNSIWTNHHMMPDGIHISYQGQEAWYSFIKSTMTQS